MTLGYTRNGMLLGLKGQGHRVNKSILCTRTAIHPHSLGGITSRWRGIELCRCLLVFRSTPNKIFDICISIKLGTKFRLIVVYLLIEVSAFGNFSTDTGSDFGGVNRQSHTGLIFLWMRWWYNDERHGKNYTCALCLLQCDPFLLPKPNHVMLNHLYALSIKVSSRLTCI